MGLLSKLFGGKQEIRDNIQTVDDNRNPEKKMYTVIVVCRKCNHEYELQIESEGKHIFVDCPKCKEPVSSEYDQKGKKFSPAQAALEAMIKKAQNGQPLFCCACGKDLTGTAAMVDRNTDAVYCDKHASSYHSSYRGNFRSCRRCGYRYHLEAGSQIRTCPSCGTSLSPGTDPK
jgi:phage FluMu protein Com